MFIMKDCLPGFTLLKQPIHHQVNVADFITFFNCPFAHPFKKLYRLTANSVESVRTSEMILNSNYTTAVTGYS